jgi:phosphoglycolate phosphatase
MVIDLDGTLIDSRVRLFTLFMRLAPQVELSFDDYWQLKRRGVANLKILEDFCQFSSNELSNFNESWRREIESASSLQHDTLLPGVDFALTELSKEYVLILATNRQFEHGVHLQLERFGIAQYFEYVGVTQQRRTKLELLAAQYRFDSKDWMISDAGEDVLYERQLGMKSCAVLSGFLDEKTLRKYQPDRVEQSIVDFARTGVD